MASTTRTPKPACAWVGGPPVDVHGPTFARSRTTSGCQAVIGGRPRGWRPFSRSGGGLPAFPGGWGETDVGWLGRGRLLLSPDALDHRKGGRDRKGDQGADDP